MAEIKEEKPCMGWGAFCKRQTDVRRKRGGKIEVCLVQIVTVFAVEEQKGIVLTVTIRDSAGGSVEQD